MTAARGRDAPGPEQRLERALHDLQQCRLQLDEARARGDEHEARTCEAAIALLQRQIAILGGLPRR